MIMQIIRFQSNLALEEVRKTAQERAEEFLAVPGLIQKYYFRSEKTGEYGGVYLWDSKESLAAYRDSELAAAIPKAYKLQGPPDIEICEVAFALRE